MLKEPAGPINWGQKKYHRGQEGVKLRVSTGKNTGKHLNKGILNNATMHATFYLFKRNTLILGTH